MKTAIKEKVKNVLKDSDLKLTEGLGASDE